MSEEFSCPVDECKGTITKVLCPECNCDILWYRGTTRDDKRVYYTLECNSCATEFILPGPVHEVKEAVK